MFMKVIILCVVKQGALSRATKIKFQYEHTDDPLGLFDF